MSEARTRSELGELGFVQFLVAGGSLVAGLLKARKQKKVQKREAAIAARQAQVMPAFASNLAPGIDPAQMLLPQQPPAPPPAQWPPPGSARLPAPRPVARVSPYVLPVAIAGGALVLGLVLRTLRR